MKFRQDNAFQTETGSGCRHQVRPAAAQVPEQRECDRPELVAGAGLVEEQKPDGFDIMAAEVRAAREAAAILDTSPFGKLKVEGPEAIAGCRSMASPRSAKRF